MVELLFQRAICQHALGFIAHAVRDYEACLSWSKVKGGGAVILELYVLLGLCAVAVAGLARRARPTTSLLPVPSPPLRPPQPPHTSSPPRTRPHICMHVHTCRAAAT